MEDRGLSVVLPAFDEERRLPATLERLLRELPTICSAGWEVIVSDDGSDDGTVQVARSFGDDVRVHRSGVNRGKGAALLSGARLAAHPLVLLLDADFPVDLESLVAVRSALAQADLVLGSRRLPGSVCSPPQPLVRRVGGRGFRSAVRVLGFSGASDPQCGVKGLRRDSVSPVLAEMVSSRYGFDVELIERARRAGLTVVERPVAWRHVEGSSLRPVRDAAATLGELARVRAALAIPARATA